MDYNLKYEIERRKNQLFEAKIICDWLIKQNTHCIRGQLVCLRCPVYAENGDFKKKCTCHWTNQYTSENYAKQSFEETLEKLILSLNE